MNKQNKLVKELREKFLEGIGVPEKSEFKPDPFQLEAIRSLDDGFDTLVVAPTGAGKTYIATEAIKKTVLSGKRAVYTAPLKALSNCKYNEFKQILGDRLSVGLLTGDRKFDGDADVVVATTEIYRNELYRYQENYALVVLDELHYLADLQRGPVWEESIILAPSSATLLMLSASISNPQDVAEWIESIRNKKVNIIRVKDRPVELRLGFLHPEEGVLPLHNQKGEVTSMVKQFYSSGGALPKRNSGRFKRRKR